MSDTNETFPTRPPSNPNRSVDKDGFRASFYPGFVRRLAIRKPDNTVEELYNQGTDTFFLPPGFTRPWASSTLEFARPDGRRIVLQVEDPHRQIDRIEVYLKGDDTATVQMQAEGEVAGIGVGAGVGGDASPIPPGGLVLICEDGPVLCPPICPEPT